MGDEVEWIPLTLLWLWKNKEIETLIISFCEFRKVEHTFAMLGPQRRWWKLWSSVSPFYNRTPFHSTKLVKHTRYSNCLFSDRPQVRIEQIHLTSEQGRKEFWIRWAMVIWLSMKICWPLTRCKRFLSFFGCIIFFKVPCWLWSGCICVLDQEWESKAKMDVSI